MAANISIPKKRVSIDPSIFVVPASPKEKPHLIGTKCNACGAHMFPQEPVCHYCYSTDVKLVPLSTTGKVYSCTIFRHHRKVPGYNGPIPYMFGRVELPEGAGVLTPFTDVDLTRVLEEGAPVELKMEKFGDDESGNEVMTFKFAPLKKK